ncbi:MAG: hypothetical protein COW00_04925 [Bdellovibrio sp. CG12_big_fil_rev_8_21_14_0_65_39_13]|nr:MAG: hypothetical protein COW78_13125 [Bdellovibrio sp. CG22_combo_CG10-13_8_21_14_all_39_27]PIQ61152.1 MAG: hypothetical protein COW00_04925 [Bdellovibrio sp. CG12_big_fil_rev_8_21_14_0_65_39_13]PIR34824.1 MAG: hypothetical protein COV37_11195 [Bdellovibrio sp. CG11_big_fil_rev_8_21_14_0_20_39_38]PJB53673.1 MAG: DUF454 domain-containing protein [Bdellovibrio sp. CG_4_9_14_3_um_filter_39_7]
MIRATQQTLYLIVGWSSLILGIIGIFLPLLPTTPFVILAAACFSKSSVRVHQWLLSRPHLGPMVKDWEQNGSISLKAKILATSMIVVLFSYSLIFVEVNLVIKIIVAITGVSVLTFIWTRPSNS